MIVLEVVITSLNLLRKTIKKLSQVSKLLLIKPYAKASCKCVVMAYHGFSRYSKMGSLTFTSIFSAVKICNYL